jgi:hypothetical protein
MLDPPEIAAKAAPTKQPHPLPKQNPAEAGFCLFSALNLSADLCVHLAATVLLRVRKRGLRTLHTFRT